MPDASGLNQQQAAADRIPYENIALGNPAEKFLNAWALTTGLKLKRDEFEGKMQALALRNSQLEADSQLKEKEFALRMGQQQLGNDYKMTMADIARQKMQNDYQHQTDVSQLAYQKYDDLMSGQTSLLGLKSQAAAKGLNPGDPGYRTFMLNGAASLTGKLPPSVLNNFTNQVDKDETAAINLKQKALGAKTQDFMHTMSDTLYGTRTNTDLNPVLNYQQDSPTLKTEYKPQGWHIPGFGPAPTPPEPTGYKLVYQRDATGKILPNPRKVPTQTFVDLNRQWQDLQAQKSTIAPIPAPSGTTVNVRTSDGKQWAISPDQVDQAKQRDPGLVIVP
jgi:hypothetical protein